MAKTVAGQFAEDLAAAGVKRIHGVVGESSEWANRRAAAPRQDRVRHEKVEAVPRRT